MAITFISVKCPECGANLEIEEGRNQMFCSYCGASIIINNENEHIYRVVDEAGIKQAETEQIIQLRKLELEEQRIKTAERNKAVKVKVLIALGIVAALSLFIGFVFEIIGFIALGSFAVLGCIFVSGFAFSSESNNLDSSGLVKIPFGISDYEEKNYVAISEMFRNAGFTNIKCVPLNDLTTGILKKPGTVDSITINGKIVTSGGRKVDPDSAVVISYHSFR